MRINITLTGERAHEFARRKDAIEEEVGTELSRPQALEMMVDE